MARRDRVVPLRKLVSFIVVVVMTLLAVVIMSTSSNAATDHTITFVNRSGEALWIGSAANTDGSRNIENLPVLAAGESASLTIPDIEGPNYWRGKFFARQRCSGQSGSTFHCLVGDCGVYADRCVRGAPPTSLAEFNFDRNDNLAPWYNVSYVDAVSLPITITPRGTDQVHEAGGCANADCSGGELLAACPAENAQYDPQTGARLLCVNPNRDAETAYSHAMGAFNPRAYLWSTQDRTSGSSIVFNCGGCAEFVVTFQGAASRQLYRATWGGDQMQGMTDPYQIPGPRSQFPGTMIVQSSSGKCIDAGAGTDDTHLTLRTCRPTSASQWWIGPGDGTVRSVLTGLCMDVANARTEADTRIQTAYCSGNLAQQWRWSPGSRFESGLTDKCLDIAAEFGENPADGTEINIWWCAPTRNRKQIWQVRSWHDPSPILGVGSHPTPIIGVGSRRCLDIPWGNAVDGAPLQIADCNGSGAQQWTFEMDGSVRALGKCMDVAWGATHNGAVIQLANCSGNLAQQFVLTSAGDLVNPQSGKCVDVAGWATADGSRLIQWECHGGSNQKWLTGAD